jgi:DNA polymerase
MSLTQQKRYLDAMGIQTWCLKTAAYSKPVSALKSSASHKVRTPVVLPTPLFDTPSATTAEKTVSSARKEAVEKQTVKKEPLIKEPAKEAFTRVVPAKVVPTNDNSTDTIEPTVAVNPARSADAAVFNELDNLISQCQLCPERSSRLHALPGQGNNNASVMIISEAPNAEEDRCGHYITGTSEILFRAMMQSIAINDDFYLTGLVKCHSYNKFLLTQSEQEHCFKFLQRQIEQLKPKVIVLFGFAQAKMLLKKNQAFPVLRKSIHSITINQTEYPVIVTYHPAYLIRNPLFKKQALADLIKIKSLLP